MEKEEEALESGKRDLDHVSSLQKLQMLTTFPAKTLLLCHHSHSPSQADVAVYEALGKAPDADKHSHVARWYEHITSYEAEHKDLTGDKAKAATLPWLHLHRLCPRCRCR